MHQWKWTRPLATFGLVLALAACTVPEEKSRTTMASFAPALHEFGDTNIVIEGRKFNEALTNEADLRQALLALAPEAKVLLEKKDLGELVALLRSEEVFADGGAAGLRGIAGFFGRHMLEAAKLALDDQGRFNANLLVQTKIKGQTLNYNYAASDGTDGNGGSGFLRVLTILTTTRFDRSRQTFLEPDVEAYVWAVKVEEIFTVVPRDDSKPQPFEGTIDFPKPAIEDTKMRGLTKKLWAKGEEIVVVSIEHDPDYDAANPDFEYIDKHWVYQDPTKRLIQQFYVSDKESCIDMLFPDSGPPATYPGLVNTKDYCLGRCASPMLVNTGF